MKKHNIMSKNFSLKKLDPNEFYTVEEAANKLEANKHTIRKYIKDFNLKYQRSERGAWLVKGSELNRAERQKRKKRQVKLRRGEYFCFSCKKAVTAHKTPTRNNTDIYGYKIGSKCDNCGGKVSRSLKKPKLRSKSDDPISNQVSLL